MSISASLANALTGLTASSRAAELVSSNVANAMNESYARRELELSTRMTGGFGSGVQVDGIRRIVDDVTIRERRLAAADLGYTRTRSDTLEDIMALIGEPGQTGSLTSVQADFEARLVEATSRPESEARLAAILDSAQALANKLNVIGDGIQELRENADAEIDREVRRLNASLERISDINAEILRLRSSDTVYPDLLDQRQKLVNDISSLVPIREFQRENGTIALYTTNGGLLLDASPSSFGFQSNAPIVADMTLQSGALSGLELNGRPIATAGPNSPIAGGRLAALFEVRDLITVETQYNLDEVSRDLVSRFENPAIDPTLQAGQPGLFTDAGAALDPSIIGGLSSRLSVNALVDPSLGGALWRLRDGLGATTQGPVGSAAILTRFNDAVSAAQLPSSVTLGAASKSLAGFTAALTSTTAQSMASEIDRVAYQTARFETLRQKELSLGVDTDQEMQKLLIIEQSYAANARVIQTIGDLIDTLLRI